MTIEEMNERKRELGLTYAEIAKRSGLPIGTVQKVLGGITKNPRFRTIQALESVLGRDAVSSVSGRIDFSKNELFSMDDFPADDHGIGSYSTAGPGRGDPRQKAGFSQERDASAKQHFSTGHHPYVVADSGAVYDAGYEAGSSARTVRRGSDGRPLGPYTNEDRSKLPEDVRTELDDGWLIRMDAPATPHQVVAVEIILQLKLYVKENNGPCRVFTSPTDVKLDEYTTYMPDVFVVCDQDKIYYDAIHGAPDLVIEVLSPSTMKRDLNKKAQKYRESGVREYWLVDVKREKVLIYRYDLEDSEDPSKDWVAIYGFATPIPVGIWDGKCKVDLSVILDQIHIIENREWQRQNPIAEK